MHLIGLSIVEVEPGVRVYYTVICLRNKVWLTWIMEFPQLNVGPEYVKVPFCKQCGIYITCEGLNLDYKVGDKNISWEIQFNISKAAECIYLSIFSKIDK